MSQSSWRPQRHGLPEVEGRTPPAWEPTEPAPDFAAPPPPTPLEEPEPEEVSLQEWAAEPEPPAAGALSETPPAHAVATRTARKDGREVVSIRCVESLGSFVVECEVHPVSEMQGEPLRRGPYTFASLREATAFMDEAARALAYLGCDVYAPEPSAPEAP